MEANGRPKCLIAPSLPGTGTRISNTHRKYDEAFLEIIVTIEFYVIGGVNHRSLGRTEGRTPSRWKGGAEGAKRRNSRRLWKGIDQRDFCVLHNTGYIYTKNELVPLTSYFSEPITFLLK